MAPVDVAVLVLGGLLAGALNSVAGGGSLITFTVLVFAGVDPIGANASGTVGLVPAAIASALGYRRELLRTRRELVLLTPVSLVGGLIGAVILMMTPQRTFVAILPVLILGATLIFTFGDRVRKRFAQGAQASTTAIVLLQLVTAIYGGYFGGGMGLVMLATFALMGMRDVHEMNALKNALAIALNLVAVSVFFWNGVVHLGSAALVAVGGITGGYLGAVLARRLPVNQMRGVVIAIGAILTVVFAVRAYG